MSERALRAALAAAGACAVGYLLPGTLQLPALVYDPVARVFGVARTVSGVQMRYYGDLLWALFAAAAAFTVVWRRSRPSSSTLGVATATALSLVALDVTFYLSRLLAAL